MQKDGGGSTMGEVRVIESDSCWERFNKTFSKSSFIILGVIAVLVFAALIIIPIISTGATSEDIVPVDYSKALIVSDERNLWALDLDKQEQTLLTKTSKGIVTFDFYKKDTIFWRESGSPWINSLSNHFNNFTQPREWDPRALAMDYVSQKVYVLDGYTGKLNVHDLRTLRYGVIVSDLKNVADIALDPLHGLMFIVQKSDSILKGNMDGTSLEKIVTSSFVDTIAVDTHSSRLYWSDNKSIESSDYEGKKRFRVANVTGTVVSLAVSGDRLYWTLSQPPTADRTLWTCLMKNRVCDQASLHQIPFNNPKLIKVYNGKQPAVKNPCDRNNAGCDQLCLLTGTTSKCACYIGHRLRLGGSLFCTLVKDYVLYVRGDFIRGKILYNTDPIFSDAILPIRYNRTSLSQKSAIDFDYNYHTSTFAFSDDETVNTINLRTHGQQKTYKRDKCLKQVSFDWVTNDIYYVRDNCQAANDTAIVLLRPQGDDHLSKTLHTLSPSSGHPKAIVFHPPRGCYYFTLLLAERAQIYKKCGLKMKLFSKELLSVNETALAIDDYRLYWFNKDKTELHNAFLEGYDVRKMNVSIVKDPMSVSVHNSHVYVANSSSIWTLSTPPGLYSAQLVSTDSELIAGVRIVSPGKQKVNPDDFCAVDNGGCQQFCIREPKRIVVGPNAVNVTDDLQKICLCQDHQTLQPDGKHCV